MECSSRQRDFILLLARVLLMLLFVLFGWQKMNGFDGTVSYMSSSGLPLPSISAAVAVIIELFLGLLLLLGLLTKPVALVLALYSFITAFIGHAYWNFSGMEQYVAMINFYKNMGLTGGFLLMFIDGAGKYSVDAALKRS